MQSSLIPLAIASLVATVAVVAPNTLTEAEKVAGYRLLFDGQTLTGWRATGNPDGWGVEDGAIVCRAMRGGYLHTEEQFGDFILSLEYRITPRANSGVFFRWSDLRDPVNTGIEMQIFDSHGKQRPGKHDDGAIYDIVAPSRNMSRPAGEWNQAVITCRDSRVAIHLNGETVCEIDLNDYTEPGRNPDGTPNKFRYAYKDLPRRGYIGFQDHGARVWFRNIKIKPL